MALEPCSLVVLWAQMSEESPSRIWPQFVAAFTDGEVDAWPEQYAHRRTALERWYSQLTHPTEVERFFVTRTELGRPDFPDDERDDDPDPYLLGQVVYPCKVCAFDHACAEGGCHS